MFVTIPPFWNQSVLHRLRHHVFGRHHLARRTVLHHDALHHAFPLLGWGRGRLSRIFAYEKFPLDRVILRLPFMLYWHWVESSIPCILSMEGTLTNSCVLLCASNWYPLLRHSMDQISTPEFFSFSLYFKTWGEGLVLRKFFRMWSRKAFGRTAKAIPGTISGFSFLSYRCFFRIFSRGILSNWAITMGNIQKQLIAVSLVPSFVLPSHLRCSSCDYTSFMNHACLITLPELDTAPKNGSSLLAPLLLEQYF